MANSINYECPCCGFVGKKTDCIITEKMKDICCPKCVEKDAIYVPMWDIERYKNDNSSST